MNNELIYFNTPHLTGKETHYIYDAVNNKGQLSGNGYYTKKCHAFFKEKYGFKHCLLTSSCTDAIEMASLLIDISPGDEVIIPSFTFVSSANPFVLRGAKIVFGDSGKDHPNITLDEIKRNTNKKTKAVVVVHYAGQGNEIDQIAEYCKENNIYLIEDAAQAINVEYKGIPLGKYGDLSTFSFHETKNIISGEGGLLVVNNERMIKRSEILWEKGTNRTEFFRGEVDKYGWVDIGSSFLPSELTAAFLWAQLEVIDQILERRKIIWNMYYDGLKSLSQKNIALPQVPSNSTNNYHIFYLICKSEKERTNLISFLNKNKINAVFHYQPLHLSTFFLKKHPKKKLKMAELYANQLVRLPLHNSLTSDDVSRILKTIKLFFKTS